MDYRTIFVFVFYFLILIYIGYLAKRRTDGFSDYVLGGREIGPYVGGLSALAADMSGFLLLALPGSVYLEGMSAMWIAVGFGVGAYINWQFVAKRVRVYTQVADNSLTLTGFLQNRFKNNSVFIRGFSALFILLFFAFYIASGLVGGAILFEESFGIDYYLSLVVGSLIIVLYTLLGGYFAVSWTTFFQGILMIIAIIIVPIFAFVALGGWSETVATVGNISLENLDVFSGTTALGIISMLAWGLGYFGQPSVIVRFMSMKGARDITVGRFVYTFFNIAVLLGAVFTGFVGISYFADNPLGNHETVFIILSQTLFNPWISSLMVVAILAAIMSTISTQLIISASTLSEDIYKGFIRKNANEKELVIVTRLSIILVSILAIGLSLNPDATVLDLVGYAWSGFAAVFGPGMLFSLFWRGTTQKGVLAGMVVGGLTVILWGRLTEMGIIPFEIFEIIPGFLFAGISVFLVSIFDNPPNEEIVQEFDQMKQSL